MASDYTIIRDISASLKALLEANMRLPRPEIVFDSPADITEPSGDQMRLSLFLYQVVENIHLRNRDLVVPDPERVVYPPIILDLYYLLTPYATQREEEFDMVEQIVQIFDDHATLKDSQLKGMLVDSGNEALRLVLHTLSLEELNHLWSTLTKPFKISLAYLVTPVHIPSSRQLTTHRTVQRTLRQAQIIGKGYS